jgi:hypothetical protein
MMYGLFFSAYLTIGMAACSVFRTFCQADFLIKIFSKVLLYIHL